MWRMSNFSTYVMWRHLKFLHMWRNAQFFYNCHSWKAEISPHNNFFSTNNISDISDKYEVWSREVCAKAEDNKSCFAKIYTWLAETCWQFWLKVAQFDTIVICYSYHMKNESKKWNHVQQLKGDKFKMASLCFRKKLLIPYFWKSWKSVASKLLKLENLLISYFPKSWESTNS